MKHKKSNKRTKSTHCKVKKSADSWTTKKILEKNAAKKKTKKKIEGQTKSK